MKVYRIRDKVSGLFSLGGYKPDWNKEGKIWKNIGHVKNHLHQMSGWDREARKEIIRIPDEWEIVEYELTETLIKIIDAKNLII